MLNENEKWNLTDFNFSPRSTSAIAALILNMRQKIFDDNDGDEDDDAQRR